MPITHEFSTATATTPDGAVIGFHSIGSGPDLLIVHGAMQSGLSQRELATLLADRFRVHLIDRRGRGLSASAELGRDEVGDLRAVLAQTGARRIFGISSGALLAARTALVDPTIEKLALFEPPLALDGSVRLDLAARVDDAVADGNLGLAMGLAMKTAEMGPPWMFRMPVRLLAAVSRRMLKSDDARAADLGSGHAVPTRQLARALPADFVLVGENADRLADFAGIEVPTMIIDGTASRHYLRKAAAALADTIPGARHVALPGQTHSVTQNADQFGHSDAIAPALGEFFSAAA